MNSTETIRGDIFSVSSLSVINEVTEKIDILDLKAKIYQILSATFISGIKTDIIMSSDKISFACPYCGDSATNSRKKRGNVFLESMTYHCFNCGKHRRIYQFLEDFNKFLNLETFELLRYKILRQIDRKIFDGFSLLLSESLHDYTFTKTTIMKSYDFLPIENTPGEIYLLQRNQRDMNNFAWDKNTKSIVIFNLDDDDNVLGFQKRLLYSKANNKYINYSLTKIFEDLKLPTNETLNEINSLSLLFGIMKLNFNLDVTVFEGSLDSFLYPNSIAMSTALKTLPFETENIYYWLDYDKTGSKKAMERLEAGDYVFLWKQFFDDYNMDVSSVDKLDFSDVYQICKNNKVRVNFKKYFSNNKMDIVFL